MDEYKPVVLYAEGVSEPCLMYGYLVTACLETLTAVHFVVVSTIVLVSRNFGRRQFTCYCGAFIIHTTLLWLRVSMPYHRFNNLREIFQGHLNNVLLRNVDSEDLRDRPCNCPGRGSCRHNNICRKALIVYTVKIPQTGKYYIGATSQTLKKRVADICRIFANS
jgi:hypothetical protein